MKLTLFVVIKIISQIYLLKNNSIYIEIHIKSKKVSALSDM